MDTKCEHLYISRIHVHRLVEIINVTFVFKHQNSSNYLFFVHFVIIIWHLGTNLIGKALVCFLFVLIVDYTELLLCRSFVYDLEFLSSSDF